MNQYYQYKHCQNDTRGVLDALQTCQEENLAGIIFEKGEYHFYAEYGAEEYCCISNHGNVGNKRCAFPLKEFQNFTVDGSGSTFIFHGVMLPFLISNAENITLKNFTVIVANVCYPQGEVLTSNENYCDVRIREKDKWDVRGGNFCAVDDKGAEHFAFNCNIFEKDSKKMVRNTGDNWPCYFSAERLNETDVRLFRFHNFIPDPGSILVFMACARVSAGIFMRNSKNITVSDVTLHHCFGMGIIAQVCDTITLERLRVTPEADSWLSVNADATHFVNCSGAIRVCDCLFENQLDDALNIHGIYLKITESDKGWAIVRLAHPEQQGVQVCYPGDKLTALDPELLIPEGFDVTVAKAEFLNTDYIKLYFQEDVTVPVNYLFENLSRQADLYMSGCTVRNNRARGMLLATKGKTVIENNYFNSTGCAILFECDGSNWFESGSVQDVVIRNNTFDDCAYCNWGNDAICVAPRKKEAEGKYYHGRIEVSGNRFITGGKTILYANNVREVIVQENQSGDDTPGAVVVHHVAECSVQEDIPYRVE